MKCSTFDNITTDKIKKYIVDNINACVWSFYGLLGSVQFSSVYFHSIHCILTNAKLQTI